ncbi:MAG: tetratricopeptide repeat protein [Myxococcales bacterium]|nr:tetratricopeptide repeat protein [Myxococcales bacterium]
MSHGQEHQDTDSSRSGIGSDPRAHDEAPPTVTDTGVSEGESSSSVGIGANGADSAEGDRSDRTASVRSESTATSGELEDDEQAELLPVVDVDELDSAGAEDWSEDDEITVHTRVVDDPSGRADTEMSLSSPVRTSDLSAEEDDAEGAGLHTFVGNPSAMLSSVLDDQESEVTVSPSEDMSNGALVRASTHIIHLDQVGESESGMALSSSRREPHGNAGFTPLSDVDTDRWQEAVENYTQEAEALGDVPAAAAIFLEIGRIYEEKLGQARRAATSYQRAFELEPANLGVLRSSRRLFSEVGNWSMVVQIIGYEIDQIDDPETRAALLSEKASILEHQLRDLDEAQQTYEASLDAWPAEPMAIAALERIHLFNEEHHALFSVYQRALEVESQAERRLPLLLAGAYLAEVRLDEPEQAMALHEEILKLDAHNNSALSALRRLYQRAEKYEALARVLEVSWEATTEEERDTGSLYLLSAVRVIATRLNRPDDSIALLIRGLERTPSDRQFLRELELLYRQWGRDDELVEILRKETQAAGELDRAPVLHRLSQALERVGQLDEAAQASGATIKIAPDYRPAIQSLGRSLQFLQKPEELAQLYEHEISEETDPQEKIIRLLKLAELRCHVLEDVDSAIEALVELLNLEQSYPPARKLLEQLLTQKGAYGDLLDFYEEEVQLTEDTGLQIFLLGRVGALAEEQLQDYARARAAIELLLTLSPRNLGAIRALNRLAEYQGDDEAQLQFLELETEATDDQAEVWGLMHRRAELLADRLGRREDAVDILNQILTLNPSYLPALRSLGRLYALDRRWEELVEMHQRELDVSQSIRRRTDLLFRIAQLREERLNDPMEAIRAYEALLGLDATNDAAIWGLADLYARQGETEKRAELLLSVAERIDSPKEQAELLIQVAELYEERLNQGDVAAELYQRVLKQGRFVDSSTRALVRIYSREGKWNALAGALRSAADRADSSQTQAAVLVRLAHVHLESLKNRDVAAELLEQAARLIPSDRDVLEQLERVCMARQDWVRAIHVGEQLAEMESDPHNYAARMVGLAALAQSQLDLPRSGTEYYRKALQAQPGNAIALQALEAAYRSAQDWEGLASIYVHESNTYVSNPSYRATLLVRAAELFEERLDKPERATEFYDQAIKLEGHHLPALRGQRRVSERLAAYEKALWLIETERNLIVDDVLRSGLTFEEGRILQDRLGDINRAISSYEKVLEAEPQHLAAFNRLEAIFLEQEDYIRVEALLRARARAVTESKEQAKLLVSAGRIAEERIKDRASAMEAYQSALAREPENASALVRLGPLLFAEQAWTEAVDIFHRTLSVTKEVEVLRDAYKSLGIIYQEHQRDLVKSVQSFQAALQSDPRDTESLYRLASLYRGARDWGSAVNVMLRLAEIEPEVAGKTSALLQLADLYLDGLKDAPHAINALRKAVELDSTCRSALIKLTELHEVREEWNDLVEVAGLYVSLLTPEERSEATPLHLRMADVFERRLGDDHRAINALRYVLEDEPKHEQALFKLATLYGKRAETYPQAVEIHRRIISEHPFHVDSYHELHRIFEGLGQHDRAFVAAEILVFLQAHTPEEYVYFQENKIFVAQMAESELTPEQHVAWVVHPHERGPLREIFELLGPELGKAYPGPLQRHDLRRENRLGPKTALPVRTIGDELTGMFQVPAFEMWLGRADDIEVHVVNDRPPALIVGGRFAKRLPPKNQRFLLGQALERIKGGHLLFEVASAQELESLVWAVVKLGRPNQRVPADPVAIETSQRQLLRHISTRTRRVLEEAARQLSVNQLDLERHREGAKYSANRAGLIASNDLETVIRAIAKGRPNVKTVFSSSEEAIAVLGQIPEVCDLLPFAISEAYFSARAHLGFSIQDD